MNKLNSKPTKKVAVSSPNLLFISWLTEWKDNAAGRDSKLQFTYSKALRSLQKYPLILSSGKECKLLEGFGDKLCAMIDDKIKKEVEGSNLSVNELIANFNDQFTNNNEKHRKSKKRSSVDSLKEDGDDNDEDENNINIKRRRQRSSSREYIPHKLSGGYALVLTLYDLAKNGILSVDKKRLMELAQPLSESSFKIPSPGSRYTAWSSMGTLLKKELVKRESCPALYSLTKSGFQLAERMTSNENHSNVNCHDITSLNTNAIASNDANNRIPLLYDSNCKQQKKTTKTNKMNNFKDVFDSHANQDFGFSSSKPSFTKILDKKSSCSFDSFGSTSSLNKSENYKGNDGDLSKIDDNFKNSQFLNDGFNGLKDATKTINKITESWFIYISDCEKEVYKKDMAKVCIEEDFGIGFLIKAKYEDLLISSLNYKLDFTKACTEPDFVYAYLHDLNAPDCINSFVKTEHCSNGANLTNKEDPMQEHKATIVLDRKMSPKVKSLAPDKFLASKAIKFEQNSTKNKTSSSKESCSPLLQWADSLRNRQTSITPVYEKELFEPQNFFNSDHNDRISNDPSCSGKWQSGATRLAGEDLEILLIVDNREFYQTTGYNQEFLIKELVKNCVPFETRLLQIGDFLWVARSKYDKNVEVVLDYLIERKRMDDLASSIIDGRFREQKARMKSCGINNQIYLIEEYGCVKNFTVSESTLNQAIVNVHLIDNYFVKRCRHTKDAALYLSMMTRYLQSLYSKCSLFVSEEVMKPDLLRKKSIPEGDITLMSFQVFNEANIKTKVMTVSDMLAKHLMQLHGVTPEKAIAIIGVYSTPLKLYNAYASCTSGKEKENLLTNIKFGTLKKNIGIAISRSVYMLYGNFNE